MKISYFIWKKYIVQAIVQQHHIYEMKLQNEIIDSHMLAYEKLITQLKPTLIKGLKIMNRIIQQTNKPDIIWTAKLNIELARMLEEEGDQLAAVQALRFCLDKILEYRDEQVARGVDKKNDVFLPACLTCNNIKISETIREMKESYIEWKNSLNRKIRKFKREKHGKKLGSHEIEEEEYEHL